MHLPHTTGERQLMFKVDDGFYDHPKVRSIPRGAARDAAVALWTLAGSWCDKHKKDGMLPADQVEELHCKRKAAEWLVAAQLWHASGHDCPTCPTIPPGHYIFHDWTQCNETKAQIDTRREKNRRRMQKWRNGGTEPDANVHDMFGGGA
jgi:hypothetical protein